MSFEILEGLAPVAGYYKAFIVDLWGVVHNGRKPYPGALDCLHKFRKKGGKVILVSNAPRTHDYVVEYLENMGVKRGDYDYILTSGDITRSVLENQDHDLIRNRGRKFYQIGATRDKGLDDGLDYSRVMEVAAADFLICTGLVDDTTETPEDYRRLLSEALSKDLPMLCANPDLTVMRGEEMIYCAGSIAALYEEMGGRVALFGKPLAETYRRAMAILGLNDASDILAIGDSIRTDIKGANEAGIDSVLVGGGIHAEEWGLENGQAPSSAQIEKIVKQYGFAPTFVVGRMNW
ncbi:MAG: TIGR01459 family HAD-type hydrolase [Alphaproteobacteria bacterium]|nr:MAG: TIGR01459 family HAD-type hydrolase [Alphaproteobacteria bacterium]